MTWRRDPLTGVPLSLEGVTPAPGGYHRVAAYLRLLGIFAVTKAVTSVLLVSYFTSKVAGTPISYELAHRALIQAVHVPIYALLAVAVLSGLSGTDLYERLLKARR